MSSIFSIGTCTSFSELKGLILKYSWKILFFSLYSLVHLVHFCWVDLNRTGHNKYVMYTHKWTEIDMKQTQEELRLYITYVVLGHLNFWLVLFKWFIKDLVHSESTHTGNYVLDPINSLTLSSTALKQGCSINQF